MSLNLERLEKIMPKIAKDPLLGVERYNQYIGYIERSNFLLNREPDNKRALVNKKDARKAIERIKEVYPNIESMAHDYYEQGELLDR